MRPDLGAIGDLNPELTLQSVINLRRILLSFRGSIQGVPAVHPDKFSRHVVGRSSHIRLVAESLRSAGFIRDVGGMVLLNQERLTELGVSYDVHQSPDWQRKIYPVLVECMKHDQVLATFLSRR